MIGGDEWNSINSNYKLCFKNELQGINELEKWLLMLIKCLVINISNIAIKFKGTKNNFQHFCTGLKLFIESKRSLLWHWLQSSPVVDKFTRSVISIEKLPFTSHFSHENASAGDLRWLNFKRHLHLSNLLRLKGKQCESFSCWRLRKKCFWFPSAVSFFWWTPKKSREIERNVKWRTYFRGTACGREVDEELEHWWAAFAKYLLWNQP